jgi:hypothetical protein
MGLYYDALGAKALLAEFDANGDARLDLAEFQHMAIAMTLKDQSDSLFLPKTAVLRLLDKAGKLPANAGRNLSFDAINRSAVAYTKTDKPASRRLSSSSLGRPRTAPLNYEPDLDVDQLVRAPFSDASLHQLNAYSARLENQSLAGLRAPRARKSDRPATPHSFPVSGQRRHSLGGAPGTRPGTAGDPGDRPAASSFVSRVRRASG